MAHVQPQVRDDASSPVSAPRSRIGTTYVERPDDTYADPDIITPAGQGDGRPDRNETAPSTFDRLLSLPDDLLSMGELVRDIRNLLSEGLDRQLWVSSSELANAVGSTKTIGGVQWAYGVGFAARMGFAVQLRHLQVGSDTAGAIFLYATRADAASLASFGPDPTAMGLKLLGVVRVTATVPTAMSALNPILEDGESLLVALQAASGKLDFACEYRAMRSGY